MNSDGLSYKWQDRMGYILALSALLCPYILTHSLDVYSIEASIWSIRIYGGTVGFTLYSLIDWANPYLILLITGPQFLTAYFMYRYYEGKTSLERVYYFAFIMLSPMLVIDFIGVLSLLANPNYMYGFYYFPFPVIVIIFALITSVYPRRGRTPQWLQTGDEVISRNENPTSFP